MNLNISNDTELFYISSDDPIDLINFNDLDELKTMEDPYIYSDTYGCWVLRNASYNDTEANPSTYCFYGLGVVITLSVFLLLSMVLALVGNTMVILTIARHRGMRTRTNLLLANLAVADILVAVLDIPIALVTVISGDWIFSNEFCDFNGFTVGLGLMLSVHTLMWISIHKFVSITRPFSRSITPTKIILMILAAWTWTVFFNLTPVSFIGLTDTEYKIGASQCGPSLPRLLKHYIHAGINTSFNLAIPFIVMTICYYKIFKEVRDHLIRMRDFADVSACNSLIEQKQISITLCIVLSIFVLFWLPYIVYSLSLVFLGKEYVPVIFNPIAYLFGYMNSACNPIIYALRSPSFRRGFGEIICGNSGRGFTGSLYNRNPGAQSSSKMVVSFKRPGDKGGVPGKDQNKKRSLNNGNMKMNIFTSTRERERLVTSAAEKTDTHDITRSYEKDNEDKSKGIVYKTMTIPSSCKASKENILDDMAHHPINVGVVNDSASKIVPDLCTEEQNLVMSNPLGSEILNPGCYLMVSSSDDRIQHFSCTESPEGITRNNLRESASQPDIMALATRKLNIHIDGSRISSSNRDILVTTLEIQDNQIRSVSVGDMRVMCSNDKLKMHCPSHCVGVQGYENMKPANIVNRERPVLWQPSVDNLFGSPVLSRRHFHIRRPALPSKFMLVGKDENKHREKKSSVTNTESHRHLGVASLITSVKRSFTDLFSLDLDHPESSVSETLASYVSRSLDNFEGRTNEPVEDDVVNL